MSEAPVPQPRYSDFVAIPWWLTECLFWLGFGLTSFVLLTLFYSEPSFRHVFHISFEAVAGVVFTRPLIFLAPRVRRLEFVTRITVLVFALIFLSQTWNLVRMLTFPFFFPDSYVWDQFGGWAFSALAIFSVWTALFYSVRAYTLASSQRERANNEHVRRLHAEKLSSTAQLKMLRYQINPHFIFNALNSVNALIATNRNQDARAMIDGLSDLLRTTLDQDPPLIVPLAQELETARRYLNVERMRFGERLEFSINADEPSLETPLPSLILQPLIENAVRHGVEAQSPPCLISIRAVKVDDRLQIVIEDTGPGLGQPSPARNRGGLGLSNVRARLQSVYGDEFHFEIGDAAEKGVKVELSVPADLPETFQ